MAAEIFTGQIQTARLLSNRIGYGPLPAPSDEVEQHLYLWADGRAQLNTYCYGNGVEYPQVRSEQMNSARCFHLLCRLADLFRQPISLPDAADCGDWSLTLTNCDGHSFHFSGSLCRGEAQLEQISDLLRETLELPELFALDGNSSSDRIERIGLDYRRHALPHEVCDPLCGKWRCQEHLTLDRAAGTLEHSQTCGGLRSSRSIHAPQQVSELLDRFDPAVFPARSSFLCSSNSLPAEYAVTVTLLHGGSKSVQGRCEAGLLPGDLGMLLRAAQDFLSSCCAPELLHF